MPLTRRRDRGQLASYVEDRSLRPRGRPRDGWRHGDGSSFPLMRAAGRLETGLGPPSHEMLRSAAGGRARTGERRGSSPAFLASAEGGRSIRDLGGAGFFRDHRRAVRTSSILTTRERFSAFWLRNGGATTFAPRNAQFDVFQPNLPLPPRASDDRRARVRRERASPIQRT